MMFEVFIWGMKIAYAFSFSMRSVKEQSSVLAAWIWRVSMPYYLCDTKQPMMKPFSCLLLCLLIGTSLNAQMVMRRKAKEHEMPPSAILVQLRTGSNQVKYYQKANRTEDLKKATEAIATANMKMVQDFNENFSYCPVYYFYDTNRQAVLAKSFSGVLLDKELNPIYDLQIPTTDTSYFIVRYGVTEDAEEWHKKTLVAADHRGVQLRHPLPLKAYQECMSQRAADYKKYKFMSNQYNVEYHGMAGAYGLTLQWFYRRHIEK